MPERLLVNSSMNIKCLQKHGETTCLAIGLSVIGATGNAVAGSGCMAAVPACCTSTSVCVPKALEDMFSEGDAVYSWGNLYP